MNLQPYTWLHKYAWSTKHTSAGRGLKRQAVGVAQQLKRNNKILTGNLVRTDMSFEFHTDNNF